MDGFVIRQAREDEMSVVRELFLEYAATLDFDLSFQSFDKELAGLPGGYAPPLGCLLLAWAGEEPVGCVALRPLDERTGEMKRLYVRPSQRGKGLGEMLVRRVIEQAPYQRVVLDTVYPLMNAAIAMYKRMGFREIPPYRTNPIPGALYMEIKL